MMKSSLLALWVTMFLFLSMVFGIIIPHSKHAYVTLLHGIDETLEYRRGFYINALITRQALLKQGSTADFIVLVGFKNGKDPNNSAINNDLNLMRERFGFTIYYLPRSLSDNSSQTIKIASGGLNQKQSKLKVLSFAEITLLKIVLFSFVQYESIQFLDGDVLPHKNMDHFFQLNRNTFRSGNISPLNAAWFLAIPNMNDYLAMKEIATVRLNKDKWDKKLGWGTEIPAKNALFNRNSTVSTTNWQFNAASGEQGLLVHYFALHNGRAQIVDEILHTVTVYEPNHQFVTKSVKTTENVNTTVSACGGLLPLDMVYHFGGGKKPWYQDLRTPSSHDLADWAAGLDALNMTVKSRDFHGKSRATKHLKMSVHA